MCGMLGFFFVVVVSDRKEFYAREFNFYLQKKVSRTHTVSYKYHMWKHLETVKVVNNRK